MVSSTYLWVWHDGLKPSINTMNEKDPSHDPCGMLPFRVSQDEKKFRIFTHCCGFIRNDANHLITEPGMRMTNSVILLIEIDWTEFLRNDLFTPPFVCNRMDMYCFTAVPFSCLDLWSQRCTNKDQGNCCQTYVPYYCYYNHFTALWIPSRTTCVSRHYPSEPVPGR